MKKTIPVLLLLLIANMFAVGQNSKLSGFTQNQLFDDLGRLNYMQIKAGSGVESARVEEFIYSTFLNPEINRLVVFKSENDELGFTHTRYTIYQNGVRVEGRTIIAHIKNGKLVSLNGDLYDVPPASNPATINESKALQHVLAKVNAKKYKWENVEEERHMKEVLNQQDFTYFPKAEKVLFESDGRIRTAYEFNIYAEEPLYRANVFVDASTGVILDEQNQICNVSVPGSAVTKYSGTQTITCDQSAGIYRLRETGRGLGIETYNCKNTTTYSSTDFTSTSSSWTTTGTDQAATDAHWGAEKTYDYYFTQHGRNSVNNAGFKLLSYVHYGNNFQNAFWDGSRMTYGDGGGGYKIFTTLDICGHEITHGLTSNTGILGTSYEAGALNESYSDIFGTCIENYSRPTNWNWKIGEDMTTSGSGLRNMSNPGLFGDPDTYLGTNWKTGTNDNGGVHSNNGVSNFWFYLLTTGGSGTNDFGNAYSISGIGFTDAAKIAFRALTVYYTSNTKYNSARNLSIQAAIDLFGNCSNQMIQTVNAWHAVGIGNKISGTTISPDFTTPMSNFCGSPATVNFTNLTAYGSSFIWDFGDGSSVSTASNAVHTYTASGSYNVKLVASGCALDSITKAAYVTVSDPSAPIVSNPTICENESVTMSVTGNNTVKWYGDSFGMNLLGVGNNYVSPAITTGTTYYVANTVTFAPAYGGMLSNTGGGYLTTAPVDYLIFDVLQSGTLNSVLMYAGSSGLRTIELRDGSNTVINTVIANLSAGVNTVVLYFPLNTGTGYRLALASGSSSYLYRSTAGVNFPYNIGSCVSITNSSAGTGSYFWFYNWEVTKDDCSSSIVPISVQVSKCTGIKNLTGSESVFEIYPNPVTNSIQLKNNSGQDWQKVTITDATGRTVLEHSPALGNEMISVDQLAGGVYYVNIIGNSGKLLKSSKFIKE